MHLNIASCRFCRNWEQKTFRSYFQRLCNYGWCCGLKKPISYANSINGWTWKAPRFEVRTFKHNLSIDMDGSSQFDVSNRNHLVTKKKKYWATHCVNSVYSYTNTPFRLKENLVSFVIEKDIQVNNFLIWLMHTKTWVRKCIQ